MPRAAAAHRRRRVGTVVLPDAHKVLVEMSNKKEGRKKKVDDDVWVPPVITVNLTVKINRVDFAAGPTCHKQV